MNNVIQQLLYKIEQINQSATPALDAWEESLHYIGLSFDSPWYPLGQLFVEHLKDLQFSPNSYHNQFHSAEAVLSAAYLIKSEFNSSTTLQYYAPILLFSMLCHDIEHNGSHNTYPYELEQKAVYAIKQCYEKTSQIQYVWDKLIPLYGLWNQFLPIVEHIILGTDFKSGPIENSKNYQLIEHNNFNNHTDNLKRLNMLANEADILLSVLSPTGIARGILLAEEQNQTQISSWAGRLFFLEKLVTYTSQASKQLDIQENIEQQIQNIKTITVDCLEKMNIEQGVGKTNSWFNQQFGIEISPSYVDDFLNLRNSAKINRKKYGFL